MNNERASESNSTTSQPRKKSGALWIVGGTVFLILGSIWWVNHINTADQSGPGAGRRKFGFGPGGGAMPVLVTPAKVSNLNVYLPALGTVVPSANITLRTQVSGQLLSVNFKEGEFVKKGDLIALVDPRPYENTLHQVEGQLLQAESQLKEAQLDLERYQALAKQDSIAKQQVDAQLALVNQNLGLVQSDQALIDSAKLNISYCHIKAPVDGRVGLRQVDAGNYVTVNDTNGIVVLTQVKPITVVFTLPEDYVSKVASRLRSGEPIPVEAYDRTQTTKLATGVLENIDNQIDTTTGTFKLRAIFSNDDDSLFPNQFVNIRMLLETETHDIVVPTSSIERSQTGNYVYIINDDNTASARTVTLGSTEGERVAITSGLKIGDRVVSDGADKLKDGSMVIVQTAPDIPSPASPWAGKRGKRKNPDGSPSKWGPSEKGGSHSDRSSAPSKSD
jgi:multidrug efflux system membrane fusion protein